MHDLQNFGFKIIDRDESEIRPVLRSLLEIPRPLELGLYYSDTAATDAVRLALACADVELNTHLDHNRLNIFSAGRELDGFSVQIEKSLSLGSSYSITHVSHTPMSPRMEKEDAVFQHLMENCVALEALCERYDNYPVYIENTFHGLHFYRYLFESIAEAGLGNIHFCFDLGHAKLWSQETLAQWLQFLLELQMQGFSLHFHLHNNAGISDDHLSFVEAEPIGLNAPDEFTEALDYLTALREIQRFFPGSRKVFEVSPALALQNLEFVLTDIQCERPAPRVDHHASQELLIN